MTCFSLPCVEHLLVQLVILAAVVMIIRLVVPWLLGLIGDALGGAADIVARAINIVLWAAVVIFVIVLCFDLVTCLIGSARI